MGAERKSRALCWPDEAPKLKWLQSVLPAASQQESPLRRWNVFNSSIRSRKYASRECTERRAWENSSGGKTRKLQMPGCQHIASIVFPTGPRDNGEVRATFYIVACQLACTHAAIATACEHGVDATHHTRASLKLLVPNLCAWLAHLRLKHAACPSCMRSWPCC
eukprot:9423262-Karenia_brevis.AAC.1